MTITKPSPKLPHYLNSAVNSVIEELWQETRNEYGEGGKLSSREIVGLKGYVSKLLNKAKQRQEKYK